MTPLRAAAEEAFEATYPDLDQVLGSDFAKSARNIYCEGWRAALAAAPERTEDVEAAFVKWTSAEALRMAKADPLGYLSSGFRDFTAGHRAGRASAEARADRMCTAIERALADSESGAGWGPDVTVCAYLREALGAAPREEGERG